GKGSSCERDSFSEDSAVADAQRNAVRVRDGFAGQAGECAGVRISAAVVDDVKDLSLEGRKAAERKRQFRVGEIGPGVDQELIVAGAGDWPVQFDVQHGA